MLSIEWEQEGCWEEVKPALKIKIERCGCNNAFSNISKSSSVVITTVVVFLLGLYLWL